MKFIPLDDLEVPMYGCRIALEQREHDWKAYSTVDPDKWENGKDAQTAIDRLIVAHPELGEPL